MYSSFVSPAAAVLRFRPLRLRVPAAQVFHLHWPEGIFNGKAGGIRALAILKAAQVVSTARRVRRSGGLVVLTTHNTIPHLRLTGWREALWQKYYPRLLHEVNMLIGLSKDSLETYRQANPSASAIPGHVIPHPHYKTTYPDPPAIHAARAQLGLPQDYLIIGIIGSMRQSKQIGEAIRTFRQTALANEMLLVMGSCEDKLWAELTEAAGNDPMVRLERGVLSDLQLATAFAAIDACLLNQATALNSGTALLALSFSTPVIAPASGALPELQGFAGDSWVSLFSAPLNSISLRPLLDSVKRHPQTPCSALDLLSPQLLSAEMLELFLSKLTN
jgi:glycosyltransferase involved in cell wall biosynthesis